MLTEPLVSVILPCYNGEKYLPKFLDSLLLQNYRNIEFIFVNDGSTDNSEQIFLEFKPKLETKGWKVLYLKQENGGAASAINTGLKHFSGKYLTWPDSDDILLPDYISKKVEYMEAHCECGLLFSVAERIYPDNPAKEKQYVKCNKELLNEDNIFESLIFERNITCVPLCTFIRSANFLEINPKREIYHNGHGQNFQMLLPMVYNFKVDFIDDVLAEYVIHEDSNSNNEKTRYVRFIAYTDVLFNVLDAIKMPALRRFKLKIKIKIHFGKMKLRYRIKQIIKFCFGDKVFNIMKNMVRR